MSPAPPLLIPCSSSAAFQEHSLYFLSLSNVSSFLTVRVTTISALYFKYKWINYFQEPERSIFHFNGFHNVWEDKIPLKAWVFKDEPGHRVFLGHVILPWFIALCGISVSGPNTRLCAEFWKYESDREACAKDTLDVWLCNVGSDISCKNPNHGSRTA